MEGKRDSVRQVCRHQMRKVFLLLQNDAIRFINGNVDVQEVRHGPLVFDVPSKRQCLYEVVVQRACPVVRVKRTQIVHVAPERQTMFDLVNRLGHAAASLGHSVDWFLDAANAWSAVGTCCRVAGRRMTVHNFVAFNRIRNGGECTQRPGAHRSTKRLIEVDATHLSAALNTQPRFQRPTALAFIHPD
eukprot:3573305-Pleurochrysis_carterae.AAC.2